MGLSDLLRFIDAYRAPLLALLAAFLVAKLVQYLSSTSKERAVPFKWERPAEAECAFLLLVPWHASKSDVLLAAQLGRAKT
jgi:hypothetical protein